MAQTTWKRSACPYDCPDGCGLLVETDGKCVYRVKGDPDHPVTRGFVCRKMQHYERTVHSPRRIPTPLRRVGEKGKGEFVPISWEEAVDEITTRWKALIAAYGAEIVLTPGAEGMQGAVDRAEALHASTPGSILAGQFDNPANPEAHELTTGPEIWADTQGKVDVLVACVGTGGTLSGTARYLKEQNPAIHVAAVEPDASPLLSGGQAGPHQIQGIGANFIPDTLDRGIYDQVIRVRDGDAFAAGRELVRSEGVLVGISSGAALWAAAQLARQPEYAGKTIVVILPDSGDRYLSSPMFAE